MTIKSFSQKYFYIRNTFLAFFHFSLLHLGLNCHAISCKKKHKLRFLCPTIDYLLHLEGLSIGAYLHSAHEAFKCWRSFYKYARKTISWTKKEEVSPPKPRPSSLGTHPQHPVHGNITVDKGQPWWSQPATMNKSDHKPTAVLPNQLSGQPLHLALTHQLYPKSDFRAMSLLPSLRQFSSASNPQRSKGLI